MTTTITTTIIITTTTPKTTTTTTTTTTSATHQVSLLFLLSLVRCRDFELRVRVVDAELLELDFSYGETPRSPRSIELSPSDSLPRHLSYGLSDEETCSAGTTVDPPEGANADDVDDAPKDASKVSISCFFPHFFFFFCSHCYFFTSEFFFRLR